MLRNERVKIITANIILFITLVFGSLYFDMAMKSGAAGGPDASEFER